MCKKEKIFPLPYNMKAIKYVNQSFCSQEIWCILSDLVQSKMKIQLAGRDNTQKKQVRVCE